MFKNLTWIHYQGIGIPEARYRVISWYIDFYIIIEINCSYITEVMVTYNHQNTISKPASYILDIMLGVSVRPLDYVPFYRY